jgi:uncharacterized membrane protein YjgN (DUF898 family)
MQSEATAILPQHARATIRSTMTSMDAPAASPATAQFPIRFTGERRAYWRLLTRGAALLMVTLGIYRFWLATDIRRFLWSNTEVAGDSLEYSGTAVELLVGFLFALAILVPIYLAFFLAALDIGPVGNMSGAIGIALLFVLGQYAIYRARRYRLSRTIYHGLRFHQQGNALFYAAGASLWWALTALTLGLTLPWMQAWRERYKMRHTYYGSVPGRFSGAGWRLFLRGLPLWLAIFLPFAAGVGALGQAYDPDTFQIILKHLDDDDVMIRLAEIDPDFFDAIGLAIVTTAISALLIAVLYPVFQAIQLRWWLSGLRIGQLTTRSHLRTTRVYAVYLRFVGYMLLFVIVLSLVAIPLLLTYGWLLQGNDVSILREAAAALIGLGAYVVAMLGFSTIYHATVMLSLWLLGTESLALDGLDTLQRTSAAGRPSSAIGEGLADALQVGGL